MNVLYTYVDGKSPIYVNHANGTIRVLVVFQDDGSEFVHYCDDYLSKSFINRIINPMSKDKYSLSNFVQIHDDAQFKKYEFFIDSFYNYSGKHKDELILGKDQGAAPIWLPNNGC
jgi:hypothetical protein